MTATNMCEETLVLPPPSKSACHNPCTWLSDLYMWWNNGIG